MTHKANSTILPIQKRKLLSTKLGMVAQAEDFLKENGFVQFRVRHHGSVARIEVRAPEIGRLVDYDLSSKLIKRFRQIAFSHIAVDLEVMSRVV